MPRRKSSGPGGRHECRHTKNYDTLNKIRSSWNPSWYCTKWQINRPEKVQYLLVNCVSVQAYQ
jgi:hypothetical protein